VDECCDVTLDATRLQAGQRRVLRTVLVINVATFVMMTIASIHSGSSSLLSGTLDNFGDAVTYALSLAVVGSTVTAKARVALVKGLLIGGAALAVALQIAWSLANPGTPVVETMGVVAMLNLGANAVCLWLLTPYHHGDVNMASAWECSRNDIYEGCAVIVATVAVWLFGSGWPDLIVATILLALFTRSAARVIRNAWKQMQSPAPTSRSTPRQQQRADQAQGLNQD
jgi:Co/Zn/Cd efflux system component